MTRSSSTKRNSKRIAAVALLTLTVAALIFLALVYVTGGRPPLSVTMAILFGAIILLQLAVKLSKSR